MSKAVRLEPIKPMPMPDVTRADVGALPRLEYVPVSALRINRAYQRSLGKRSVTLIRSTVRNFDWARMKALSVLELGGGLYEVLDGQHTAIAAASHGSVDKVPCLISTSRPTHEAAAAFVDLNTHRVNLTPLQVFAASVAAGDEIAVAVATGVQKGGGRLLQAALGNGNWQEGDTVAIGTLKKLAKEGDWPYVRRVIAIGKKARLKPIGSDFIVAFSELIWFRFAEKGVSDATIVDLIRIHGPLDLLNRARVVQQSKPQGVALGVALAEVFVRLAP